MDCSLPGSFVHGIFQARVLEWVAIAFSTMDMGLGELQEWVMNREASMLWGMGLQRVGQD